MIKAPPASAPVAATPNAATVVFIRDSGLGFGVNFSIVDQDGSFFGDAVARSHFSLQMPAGRYFFLARGGEGTDIVQAQVAAGYQYHVRVISHMGFALARVELDPIKPTEKEWQSLPRWLAETNHLVPLAPRVPASNPQGQLNAWASQVWSSLTTAEQAAHTIAPTDGSLVRQPSPAASREPVAAAN